MSCCTRARPSPPTRRRRWRRSAASAPPASWPISQRPRGRRCARAGRPRSHGPARHSRQQRRHHPPRRRRGATPTQDWDAVLEVNLSSAFRLCRAAGRAHAGARAPARSSTSPRCCRSRAASACRRTRRPKAAIAQLTKALANEWAGKGVNVNAIAPGYMRTDNTRALADDPVRYRQILDRIPAGRWGEPDDLGGAIVFLASSGVRLRARACARRRRRMDGTMSTVTNARRAAVTAQIEALGVVAVIRLKDPAALRAVVRRDGGGRRPRARGDDDGAARGRTDPRAGADPARRVSARRRDRDRRGHRARA